MNNRLLTEKEKEEIRSKLGGLTLNSGYIINHVIEPLMAKTASIVAGEIFEEIDRMGEKEIGLVGQGDFLALPESKYEALKSRFGVK